MTLPLVSSRPRRGIVVQFVPVDFLIVHTVHEHNKLPSYVDFQSSVSGFPNVTSGQQSDVELVISVLSSDQAANQNPFRC